MLLYASNAANNAANNAAKLLMLHAAAFILVQERDNN